MPPREVIAYLDDIEAAAARLLRITQGRSYEGLTTDEGLLWAVERGVQNIGEAVFQIKRIAPDAVKQIDQHERIVGCRHVLVHAYFEVNPMTLWDIVTIHLEPLLRSVDQLRAQLEPGTDPP
ncbi:MAG: HepT-like ribonuclease domain-containing protein [Planctomycetota bacterium]